MTTPTAPGPDDVLALMRQDHAVILRHARAVREADRPSMREDARSRLESALVLHMHTEQHILYEAARGAPSAARPLEAACDGHDALWHRLADLMEARIHEVPRVAAAMERELRQHFEAEERDVFPLLERVLAPLRRSRLRDEVSLRKNELLQHHATTCLDPERSSVRLPPVTNADPPRIANA